MQAFSAYKVGVVSQAPGPVAAAACPCLGIIGVIDAIDIIGIIG